MQAANLITKFPPHLAERIYDRSTGPPFIVHLGLSTPVTMPQFCPRLNAIVIVQVNRCVARTFAWGVFIALDESWSMIKDPECPRQFWSF